MEDTEFVEGEDFTIQPKDWEIDEDDCAICICSLPKTDDIISCSSEACPIGIYHAGCVGLSTATATSTADDSCGVDADTAPRVAQDCGGSGVGVLGTISATIDRSQKKWICDLCLNTEIQTKDADEGGHSGASKELPKDTAALSGPSTASSNECNVRKEKRKVSKFGSRIQTTKDELLGDSTYIFQDALKMAEEEEHLKRTSNGQEVLKLFRAMLIALLANSLLSTLANNLIESIYNSSTAGDNFRIGPESNSRICSEFHATRTDPQMNKLWDEMIETLDLQFTVSLSILRIAQQYLMRRILLIIIKRRVKEDPEEREQYVNLTDHDQNVIRYVAGYIPHALLKRYKKSKSSAAKRICDTLKSWRSTQENVEADSFLEYTCAWTNLVDRGFLFKINDNVFKLFRAMEIQTQKLLNLNKLPNQNLGEVLSKSIASNVFVLRCWHTLTEDFEGRENEFLFSSVVNYWVKIRVKAFVKVHLNILRKAEIKQKKQKKLARKGEKSLRKSLKV